MEEKGMENNLDQDSLIQSLPNYETYHQNMNEVLHNAKSSDLDKEDLGNFLEEVEPYGSEKIINTGHENVEEHNCKDTKAAKISRSTRESMRESLSLPYYKHPKPDFHEFTSKFKTKNFPKLSSGCHSSDILENQTNENKETVSNVLLDLIDPTSDLHSVKTAKNMSVMADRSASPDIVILDVGQTTIKPDRADQQTDLQRWLEKKMKIAAQCKSKNISEKERDTWRKKLINDIQQKKIKVHNETPLFDLACDKSINTNSSSSLEETEETESEHISQNNSVLHAHDSSAEEMFFEFKAVSGTFNEDSIESYSLPSYQPGGGFANQEDQIDSTFNTSQESNSSFTADFLEENKPEFEMEEDENSTVEVMGIQSLQYSVKPYASSENLFNSHLTLSQAAFTTQEVDEVCSNAFSSSNDMSPWSPSCDYHQDVTVNSCDNKYQDAANVESTTMESQVVVSNNIQASIENNLEKDSELSEPLDGIRMEHTMNLMHSDKLYHCEDHIDGQNPVNFKGLINDFHNSYTKNSIDSQLGFLSSDDDDCKEDLSKESSKDQYSALSGVGIRRKRYVLDSDEDVCEEDSKKFKSSYEPDDGSPKTVSKTSESNHTICSAVLDSDEDMCEENTKKFKSSYDTDPGSPNAVHSYFDDEAELSGEDNGAEDNEEEFDEEEYESMIDNDVTATDENLRNEIATVHLKQLRDDDENMVRRVKNHFLSNGDLYSETGERMKTYSWQNPDVHKSIKSSSSESESEECNIDATPPQDYIKWKQENLASYLSSKQNLELSEDCLQKKNQLKVYIIGSTPGSSGLMSQQTPDIPTPVRRRGSFLGSDIKASIKLKESTASAGTSRKSYVFLTPDVKDSSKNTDKDKTKKSIFHEL